MSWGYGLSLWVELSISYSKTGPDQQAYSFTLYCFFMGKLKIIIRASFIKLTIYFVNDLFTDKPSKFLFVQKHYFNDIHMFLLLFLLCALANK